MEENNNKNNGRNRRRSHRPAKRPDAYTPPYEQTLLAKPLDSIGLNEGTLQVLLAGKLATVGDVVRRRAREMYRVQNFGKRHLQDLTRALQALGVDYRPDEAPDANSNERGAQPNDRPANPNAKPQQRQANGSKPNRSPATDTNAANGERRLQKSDQRGQNNAGGKQQPSANQPNSGKKNKKGQNADDGLTIAKLYAKPKLVHSPRIEAVPDKFVKFQRGGKWGFRDQSGTEVIPPIYDEVFNFKEDYACVERKQLFGYINRENELVIPYKYVCASSFSEGYACVGDEERCGYINKQGEVVVPFIYEAGTAVHEGRAHVKQDGKWGTLTIATNEISWA